MSKHLFATLLVGLSIGCSSTEDARPDDVDASGFDVSPDVDASGFDVSPDVFVERDSGIADADVGGDSGSECVPDEAAWGHHAQAIVGQRCAGCHGAMPQFGAPFSLLDYEDLVAGATGSRLVDFMARELLAGTMPPAAQPQLTHQELATLVGWATCGQEHPHNHEGLQASAPVWAAPDEVPEGLESFDVTADGFVVGPQAIDAYQCFSVEVPIDSPRFIRRIEPVIDDGRVLHHSLVAIDRRQAVNLGSFGCSTLPPGDEYVYAWGPGQSPIQFPDGGLRINPGDRMVLQIHYNNGAGIEGIRDSSGLRIFHEPVGGTEYAMAEQYTFSIHVPPRQRAESTTTCTVNQEVDLIGNWPHMHQIGSEFHHVVTRVDGTVETIIELTGWRFETQLIYHTPMTLRVGDQLKLTCVWDNPYDHPVGFGTRTEDEMCFSFMYVTPARPHFCN